MTAITHFENCIKYEHMSTEQPIAKRAEVGPIVPHAMRAETWTLGS